MSRYKVNFYPSIEESVLVVHSTIVPTLEEAKRTLDAIASYTLFLHQHKLMEDDSNFGEILGEYDGDWLPLEDETDY